MTFFNNDLFLNFFDHLFLNGYFNSLWLLTITVIDDGDSFLSNCLNYPWNFFCLENNLFLVQVANLRLSDDIRDFLFDNFKSGLLMDYRNVVRHFDDFSKVLI